MVENNNKNNHLFESIFKGRRYSKQFFQVHYREPRKKIITLHNLKVMSKLICVKLTRNRLHKSNKRGYQLLRRTNIPL